MADIENMTVMPDPLREFVGKVFIGHGVPPQDAATIADHLVEADLRGVYSHGVIRVEPYTNHYRAGAMNPRPNSGFRGRPHPRRWWTAMTGPDRWWASRLCR